MAPKQITLASEFDAGFGLHRKATRRDRFLAEMEQAVPWAALCAVIERCTSNTNTSKASIDAKVEHPFRVFRR